MKSLTNKQLWKIYEVISELESMYNFKVMGGAEPIKKLERKTKWAKKIIQKHRATAVAVRQ